MRFYKHKGLFIDLDHISAIEDAYQDPYYKLYMYKVYMNGIVKDFSGKTLDEYNALIEAWQGSPEINADTTQQPQKRGKRKS